MKKKVLVIMGTIIFIAVVAILAIVLIKSGANRENLNNDDLPQIELGTKQVIETPKRYGIKGTKDTFIVTEKIEPADVPEGALVEVSILIPYTITVNGREYNGEFLYGNYREKGNEDKNPKYDIKFNSIPGNGMLGVTITRK